MHRTAVIHIASDIRRQLVAAKTPIRLNPKLANRHWNLALGVFQQSAPQHAYGKAEANRAAVEERILVEIADYQAKNPNATEDDIKKRRLSFLNAARKHLYDQLSDEDQATWVEEAKRVAPVDEEEL